MFLFLYISFTVCLLSYRANTEFNLAPAGFGPTSFRLAEIIQLGRVPVHISTDLEWLPYATKNSPGNIQMIGYSGNAGNLVELIKTLKSLSEEEVAKKLALVKEARAMYTYEGVMTQIEAFLKDPLKSRGIGSYLTCQRVPDLFTWGFWWDEIKKNYLRSYISI